MLQLRLQDVPLRLLGLREGDSFCIPLTQVGGLVFDACELLRLLVQDTECDVESSLGRFDVGRVALALALTFVRDDLGRGGPRKDLFLMCVLKVGALG